MSLASIALVGVALAGKGPPTTPILKEKVDLNGDGKADKITVQTADGQGGLKGVQVLVGSATLSDQQLYKEVSAFIVDVNTGDKKKELMVEATSESGKKWFTIFVWDGKKVLQAMKMDTGGPTGAVKLVDHGEVVVEKSRDYWTERRIWALDGFMFVEREQPFLAVGALATANEDVQLAAQPKSVDTVATVPAGATVEIVLTTGDAKAWVLVKSDLGLLGWVDATEIGDSLTPTGPAGE